MTSSSESEPSPGHEPSGAPSDEPQGESGSGSVQGSDLPELTPADSRDRPAGEGAESGGRASGIDDPARLESLEAVSRLGLEFQESYFGAAIERLGARPEWLAERAFALSELGRYQESLALDRAVVDAAPEDPTAHYNLACSLCLVGQLDAALAGLERALELGYKDRAFLAEDPDLVALHDHPRFLAIVAGQSDAH